MYRVCVMLAMMRVICGTVFMGGVRDRVRAWCYKVVMVVVG